MFLAAQDARPAYTIDASDRIIHVNAAWLMFQSSDDDVARDYLGLPVWELLGDGEVRQVWQVLHGRVRGIGASVFVPMRVDTAAERRLLDVELRPLADRCIQHICECAWTEARAPVALLDPTRPRDHRHVRCCAWCARIQVGIGVWQEIEDAERTLAVESAATLPGLRTGACVTCKQALLQTFPAKVA